MPDDLSASANGWTADDASMAELRGWLIDRGFIVIRDDINLDLFGNQEVILTRPVAIRLVSDRGEWRTEVMGPDGQWAGIEQWSEGLRGKGARLVSAADEADLLRETLDEIERNPASPRVG
jgi:hypothetical protein